MGFLRAMPASDSAIAMACLRDVTFLPELDFKVPAPYSRMTFETFFSAFVGFLAMVGGAFTQFMAYRDWETDRKSTRLNSSHLKLSRMPSSA